MKHTLANFPRCCLDGPHYCETEAYLQALIHELRTRFEKTKEVQRGVCAYGEIIEELLGGSGGDKP